MGEGWRLMGLRHEITKAWGILVRRLRQQGLGTTLQWVWGRGWPRLTGVPTFKSSRITPEVYVGAQFNRRGRQALLDEGITGVINMRVEYDDAAHGLALPEYCHLPTVDDSAPSVEHLQIGVDFMCRVIGQGGKVYIHCKGGIGRAPTMAAAYFISQGCSTEEAIAVIQETRPFIHITAPQLAALHSYEESVSM